MLPLPAKVTFSKIHCKQSEPAQAPGKRLRHLFSWSSCKIRGHAQVFVGTGIWYVSVYVCISMYKFIHLQKKNLKSASFHLRRHLEMVPAITPQCQPNSWQASSNFSPPKRQHHFCSRFSPPKAPFFGFQVEKSLDQNALCLWRSSTMKAFTLFKFYLAKKWN